MLDSRRGVSSFIAAVILIAFTVAVATILFIWASRFLTTTQKDVDTTTEETFAYVYGVHIYIHEFTAPRIIKVENRGSLDIVGFIVRGSSATHDYFASSFALPKRVNIPGERIKPFEIKPVVVNFDFSSTHEGWFDLGDVDIIPFVESSEGPVAVSLKKKSSQFTGTNYCGSNDVNGDFIIGQTDIDFFRLTCFGRSLDSYDTNGQYVMPSGCEAFDFNNGVIDPSDGLSFSGTSDYGFYQGVCYPTLISNYYTGSCSSSVSVVEGCEVYDTTNYCRTGPTPFAYCTSDTECDSDDDLCYTAGVVSDGCITPTEILSIIDVYNRCTGISPPPQSCDPLDHNNDGVITYDRSCSQVCILNAVCESYWGESCTNCIGDCGSCN